MGAAPGPDGARGPDDGRGVRGPGGRAGTERPAVRADDARPPFAGGLLGFVGYDAGRDLERIPAIARDDLDLPRLALALHDWVLAIDGRDGRVLLCGRPVDGDEARLAARMAGVRARLEAAARQAPDATASAVASAAAAMLDDHPGTFASGMDRVAWSDRVERVRAAIAAGEIYQANLARRLEAPFAGDPWPLFGALRAGDPAPFAAYVDLGPDPATGAPRAIVSASPEPFLAVDAAGHVASDPIKGTRPRGRTRAEDRALACELLASEKDRAENVMIVDVLRNDLGRVCIPGSVAVPRLCRLERTGAVQHLVSTVVGRLAPGRDALDLLAASFPGGSITGAPKIRAMRLIEELEPVRRGPYCGAALWIGPDGAMGSSILIRTFVADGRRLTLHVGGGITRRSDAAAEWDETCAKARGPLRAIGAVEA
jgi:para-aminobenzoate synthetase component 1